MKKCPFCNANIENNARFCLHCMNPLNQKEVIPPLREKKRWWLAAFAIALPVLLLAMLMLQPWETPDTPKVSTSSHSQAVDTQLNIPSSTQITTSPSTAPTAPVTQPVTQSTTPVSQPTSLPATQPTTKPVTQPTTTPATQSTTPPATQPTTAPHSHTYSRRNTSSTYLKTDATCTATAVYYYSCSCGAKGSDTFSYGAKKDHIPVEDAGYPATCLVSGLSSGSHCRVCNTTIKAQTVLSPTGHSPVIDPEIPPGCTTPGKTEGSHCKTCNATIVAQQEIQPAGHKYSETEFGMPTICSVCGALGPSTPSPSLSIAKPTLPTVQYGRLRITNCIEKREYNGDGTFDVQLTFTVTNITSSTLVSGVWATLSGIEPSDGRSIELNPGESGTCSVYFYTVPAGNYTIMLE